MINLHGTKKGGISIERIEKPYGEKSSPVVSIGIFLNKESEEPNWKSHIPIENLEEVIKELQKHLPKN